MKKNLNYENVALWGLLFVIVSALTAKKVITLVSSKSEFKTKMKPIAEQIKASLGIDPNIVMTQAALESGWGQSGLTRQNNNLFGMTAGADWIKYHAGKTSLDKVPRWTAMGDGRSVAEYPTNEHSTKPPEQISYWEIPGDILEKKPDGKGGTNLRVKRYFRAYKDWGESVADWARKIATSTRYSDAYQAAKTGNAAAFGAALQAAGYATDPKYAAKITQLAQIVRDTPEATA